MIRDVTREVVLSKHATAPWPVRRGNASSRPSASTPGGKRPIRRGRVTLTSLSTIVVAVIALAAPVLGDARDAPRQGALDLLPWFGHSFQLHSGKATGDSGDLAGRTTSNPTSAPSSAATSSTSSATGTAGADSTSGADGTSGATTGSVGGDSAAGSATHPFIAYSADSFFRRPLPAVTRVSASSASMVAYAKANDPSSYPKIRGANGVGWGIAYAEAHCSDPTYRISASGNVPASQQHLRDVGFHAPPAVWENLPPNGDAPFLVIDRCGTSARPGGLSVWGANAVVSGHSLTVSAAGSFAHDSNGLDRRNPLSNSSLNERSRGVIPDSMAIRVDLLDQAIRDGTGLGHVLEVFWMETNSATGWVHPMVGAENGKAGAGAEGQRFRIKSGVDLGSRPGCTPTSNPVGLAIARTLQQNGAYLGDNSGSGSGIKTEQNAHYPGLTADSLRGCMTWDDIEFLPLGWDG